MFDDPGLLVGLVIIALLIAVPVAWHVRDTQQGEDAVPETDSV